MYYIDTKYPFAFGKLKFYGNTVNCKDIMSLIVDKLEYKAIYSLGLWRGNSRKKKEKKWGYVCYLRKIDGGVAKQRKQNRFSTAW